MSPELDKKLCEKYPKIFAQRHGNIMETCMCWGFEVGDGWFSLIDSLCEQLQKLTDEENHPQVVAEQVKEKFGALRFYVDGASDKQRDLIWKAENHSMNVCETCGKPGAPQRGGWIRTLCPTHAKERNA